MNIINNNNDNINMKLLFDAIEGEINEINEYCIGDYALDSILFILALIELHGY